MSKIENLSFKYKHDKYYNIVGFVCFVLFIISIFIILKRFDTALTRLLFILLSFIFFIIVMYFVSKKLTIFNATITYNNTSFDYDTMKKEYSISYDEIEYITKETYMDTTSLIRYENYIYKVKIKNAGSFIFKYYDDSLDKAIKKLSIKSNIPINDLT